MARLSPKSLPPVLLACALAAAGVGVYGLAKHRAPSLRPASAPVGAAAPKPAVPQVQVVAENTRRLLPSTAPDGTLRTAPKLPSLEEALGLDSRLAFDWRLEVVHKLKSPLTSAQVGQLLAFVGEKRLPAGLTGSQVLALKNDVLNVLVAQKDAAPALAALLRGIHDDPTQEPGMRDYALQHLASLETAARTGTAPQWQAVQGSDPALAATAMLQLQLQARDGGLNADERTRLARAAAKLAADATLPETSRSTALLICGQLKVPEARALAYEIARSTRASYPFRIAAVATLGDLGGGSEVQAYLQKLASGPERRLQLPARSALKRFAAN